MAHVRTAPKGRVVPSMSTDNAHRFRMVDHIFEVRTTISVLGDVMDHLLAPFACTEGVGVRAIYDVRNVDRPGDRRRYELLRNGRPVGRVSSIGLLVDLLVRDTTDEVVSTTAYTAVHAAAAAREGRAVILPAPGGHGKTTTVAALVRGGWEFLTDEVTLISRENGLVHPFPRPLSISPGSISLLPGLKDQIPPEPASYRHYDHHVSPDDLRPGCVSGPVPVALVVFPSYSRGAVTTLTRISRAEALIELLRGTFNRDLLGRDAVGSLAGVVDRSPCYRLSIGAIDAAVRTIDGLLRETRSAGVDINHGRPGGGGMQRIP